MKFSNRKIQFSASRFSPLKIFNGNRDRSILDSSFSALAVLFCLLFLLPCFTGCTEREAVSASFDSGTGDEAQQETDSVKQTQDAGTSPAADSTPPVIYGVKDKKIAIGDPVAYKAGVYAIDDRDGTVPVQVDSSKVDRNTAGTYPVIYTAEDSAGNIASVESRIIVEYISDAMMNEALDNVLKEILTEDMTLEDKIYQIWYWTSRNIRYTGSSIKLDLKLAAYEGLQSGRGDCYTYFAVNTLLLDRAGIENRMVTRKDDTSNHWWNLVNFGEDVWYFIDSCPVAAAFTWRVDRFKMTDSDLKRYTTMMGRNYYTYNPSLYQDITIAS